VLTNRKEKRHKGKVQLIDARQLYVKMRKSLGNKRNKIGDKDEGEPDQIGDIARIHGDFRDGETREFVIPAQAGIQAKKTMIVNKVFDNADFGFHKITVERPLRLNFQASAERIAQLEDESGFRNLATSSKKSEAARREEIAAGETRQEAIRKLLRALGKSSGGKLYKDREAFLADLKALDRKDGVRLSASELKAVLAAVGERDETAEICRDAKGNPEPDPDLRDTESVPLKESIEAYFKREVLPHVPNAWIDESKTKVGYEIPLNRHFYRYEPPRPLEEIEADIKTLEDEIVKLLREATV
jgi:type I restriction enzyme M protein